MGFLYIVITSVTFYLTCQKNKSQKYIQMNNLKIITILADFQKNAETQFRSVCAPKAKMDKRDRQGSLKQERSFVMAF